MKNTVLHDCITEYDSNKGYLRTLKDESHIRSLRNLANKVCTERKRDLTSVELCNLATIVVGKKNRDEQQLSASIFKALADKFGGYEALDTLEKEKYLLDAITLEENPTYALECAQLLVSIPFSNIQSRRFLFELFNILKHSAINDDAKKTIAQKLLVVTHSSLDAFEHIACIIGLLDKANKKLLNQNNWLQIVTLQHPSYFYALLKAGHKIKENHANLETNLNTLFQARAHFDTWLNTKKDLYSEVNEIFKAFVNAQWNFMPYLLRISNAIERSPLLLQVIQKLIANEQDGKRPPLSSELRTFVLNGIFDSLDKGLVLLGVVNVLSDIGVTEHDLTLIKNIGTFEICVAKGIVALKKAKHYNDNALAFIIEKPEYAHELAQFIVYLHEEGCFSEGACRAILKHPQCLPNAIKVLSYLKDNNLHSTENINAICNIQLLDDTLLKFLLLMKKSDLLSIFNLPFIIEKVEYIKTLYSAAKCLSDAKKFDELNFNSLLADPIHALNFLDNIRLEDINCKFVPNEGIKDFVKIRQTAMLLASGQRQHCFFKEMTPEHVKNYEKTTGKKMSTFQQEILIKIAENCSNHNLEREVEHHIAQSSYHSLQKK